MIFVILMALFYAQKASNIGLVEIGKLRSETLYLNYKMLIFTGNNEVKLIDLKNGGIDWTLKFDSKIYKNQTFNNEKPLFFKGKDGSIYFTKHNGDELFIHRLPGTIQQLAEKSYLVIEDFFIVGSKKSTLLAIDAESGKIVYKEKPGKPRKYFVRKGKKTVETNLIFLTKTDYALRVFSKKDKSTSWDLSVSEMDLLDPVATESKVKMITTGPGGHSFLKNENEKVIWQDYNTIFGTDLTKVYLCDSQRCEMIVMFEFFKNSALDGQSNTKELVETGNCGEIGNELIKKPNELGQIPVKIKTPEIPLLNVAKEEFYGFPKTAFYLALIVTFLTSILALLWVRSLLKKKHSKPIVQTESINDLNNEPLINDSTRKLKFEINFDEILGRGSHGTTVFSGVFDGRKVAVKRLLKDIFQTSAQREINLLLALDIHPNVVRYYSKDEDDYFIYIALERCQSTLAEAVEGKGGFSLTNCKMEAKKLFVKGIFKAVNYLHAKNIVHRDLKPQNILVCGEKSHSEIYFSPKVADMGLSKKLEIGQNTFETNASGSSGWQPPEVVKEGKHTKAIDVFSLGCILFYILSGGSHPFGEDPLQRQNNISTHKPLLIPPSFSPEATHLIAAMISPRPPHRPLASDALLHPFFWPSEKALRFLCAVSNRFEREPVESPARALLESGARGVVGSSWRGSVGEALVAELGRYRRYDFSSVRDLLRVIRNKAFHHRELSEALKAELGSFPGGFLAYFTERFPRLLLYGYLVAGALCPAEEAFAPFFEGTSAHYRELLLRSVRGTPREGHPFFSPK